MKNIKPPKNCPQYIFQPRLFGLIEVVYTRDSLYMTKVGFAWRDKWAIVIGKGFIKL